MTPTFKKEWFDLDPAHTDPKRVRAEREKARALKQSQWWRTLKNRGVCHYCEKKVGGAELTMDHVVPIARGGTSTKGNIVPSCRDCNQKKSLATPVDQLLAQGGQSEDHDE